MPVLYEKNDANAPRLGTDKLFVDFGSRYALQGETDRFRLMSAVQTVHSTALMMQNALLPQATAPFIPLQSEVMRSA